MTNRDHSPSVAQNDERDAKSSGWGSIHADDLAAIIEWFALSASVIKSGEPWTNICERVHRNAKDALLRLIQTRRELVAALKHEVANCPLCKGEGRAVDIMEMLRATPLSGEEIAGEKVECPRCKDHRALIACVAKAEGRS